MAQRVRPKQSLEQDVTMETSIQQVTTLLETGVACISYLRGLFVEDNFVDAQILAPRPAASSSNPSGSQQAEAKKGDSTSVRVKKLVRGRNDEADKLLDYLDKGAADAIRRGFLAQLILAIYLDPNDPTNIVEAYTFTFSYETDAEGNKRPEMDVRDKLGNMVISSSSSFGSSGRKKSKVKEGEVKRQVQRVIKNLITSTQALDELPRRRFLTVRLFFNEDCPPEYEPPLFQPVDASQADYSITTAATTDQPEVGTLGALNTGFHGVSLHTISISHLLNVEYDENIPAAECLERNQRDAATRNVVWDAEELVSSITDDDAKVKPLEPVGIRDEQGVLHSVEEVKMDDSLKDVRVKVGLDGDDQQMVLSKGQVEAMGRVRTTDDNDELQHALAATTDNPWSQNVSTQPAPIVSRQKSFRPPVPLFDEAPKAYAERAAAAASRQLSRRSATDLDGEKLPTVDEDAEMVDGEIEAAAQAGPSRVPSSASTVQEQAAAQGFPIASLTAFANAEAETQLIDYTQHPSPPPVGESSDAIRSEAETPTVKAPAPTKLRKSTLVEGRDFECCECGDDREAGDTIACSSCEVRKHLCCYGFEGVKDKRIPDQFVCYPCRVDLGPVEALLNPERLPEITGALNDLRSLALFRRAIATIWKEGVLDQSQLSDKLGVDRSTAAQLITRLRNEKFIVEKAAPKGKGKGKSQTKKPLSSVSKSNQQRRLKSDTYFNPGGGAETDLIDLLTSSEADAEGEEEVETVEQPPAFGAPIQTAPGADRSLVPSHAVVATKSGGLVLVEESIDTAHFVSPRRISHEHESPEDDPIGDYDDDASPIAQPEKTRPIGQENTVEAQSQPVVKSTPYIPKFPKGKTNAAKPSSDSPFQRASSAKIMPSPSSTTLMDVDHDMDDEPEPDTQYDSALLEAPPPALTAAFTSSKASLAAPLQPVTRSPSNSTQKSGKRAVEESTDVGDESLEPGISQRMSKRNKRCVEAGALEV